MAILNFSDVLKQAGEADTAFADGQGIQKML